MKRRLLPLMLIAALGLVACGKDESAVAPEAAKVARSRCFFGWSSVIAI
jgi:hypothetical protein